ncbi:serine/threonine-protein kinase [Solwaraspora sp. WMMD791]|uniref:serine/threonine-protein kinase n=1 Tax=Solwaraspora sp. WMMD791 TaxID=3016086 RepID=UPI00249BF1B4|nr:serine/threonine-protein kinase [Solwaraspora sp. WMMD791]WFE29680.1 serine/threonine-protein kinase [Solwaraspora sp. WMMD791]
MGTTILRRYVLLRPIGRGGVSVVYRAIDIENARPIAVKLLAPAVRGDRRAHADIRREAMIADRLRHPSVPRVYDVGEMPLGGGDTASYVAMELLTGRVLTARLRDGPLPWSDAVRIAATAADVLAVAHRRGVVHRDLTPGNVMLTGAGAKIIDFGLATVTDRPGPGPGHRTGWISGPRRPDLPAHPVGGPGRPSDDVYALGVLLYQMVTGSSPYPAARPGRSLADVRFSALAPTPVLNVTGMPRAVAELCRALMGKRADNRPSSSEAAFALWELLDRPAAEAVLAGRSSA